MLRPIVFLATVFLVACAAGPREPDAFDDFVAVSELPTVEKIRTDDRDRWTALSDRYLVYRTRKEQYLFRFQGRCPALLNQTFNPRFMEADIRYDQWIRPRIDTIRGCPIEEIYAVTPEQIVELVNIGEAPGPR
jgi:hypothetical protein